MRLDRELSVYILRLEPLRRAVRGIRNRFLPILMYHSVCANPERKDRPYYSVTTHPQVFAAQMDWLKNLGYTGVSLEEALRMATRPQGIYSRIAAITFDDGFMDFHTAAWPILREHGFTATMYLSTEFIGNRRRSFNGRDCLTWSEVRDLRDQGVRFGSHTVHHPKLYQLSWDEIENELVYSKDEIEQRLGEPVTTFSYPYAYPQADRPFVETFTQLLIGSGYESCATTQIGRANVHGSRFSLKRLPVNGCDDFPLFRAKLEGAYDWLNLPQLIFKECLALLAPQRTRTKTAKSSVVCAA